VTWTTTPRADIPRRWLASPDTTPPRSTSTAFVAHPMHVPTAHAPYVRPPPSRVLDSPTQRALAPTAPALPPPPYRAPPRRRVLVAESAFDCEPIARAHSDAIPHSSRIPRPAAPYAPPSAPHPRVLRIPPRRHIFVVERVLTANPPPGRTSRVRTGLRTHRARVYRRWPQLPAPPPRSVAAYALQLRTAPSRPTAPSTTMIGWYAQLFLFLLPFVLSYSITVPHSMLHSCMYFSMLLYFMLHLSAYTLRIVIVKNGDPR
jgi:hypothetical protein